LAENRGDISHCFHLSPVKINQGPTSDILLVRGRCVDWEIQHIFPACFRGTVLYRLILRVRGYRPPLAHNVGFRF